MNLNGSDPIGVFDSGLGGLTVVKELMHHLPNEGVVYFGDTARVPYGTKSKEAIIRFSKENVAVLMRERVKMVVVACNTASSWALDILKDAFPIPILGVIAPGARKAAQTTRNKRVGVIATQSTVKSGQYAAHIAMHDKAIEVVSKACPLFVPLVEEGWFDTKVTYEVAQEYLTPLKKAKVDTVILGCTHYPLIKKVVQDVMGPDVTLVDSATEVAVEVKHLLMDKHSVREDKKAPKHLFLVSDEPAHFHAQAARFLGQDVKNVKRCYDV